MIRITLFLILSTLLTVPTMAANAPGEWRAEDYPRRSPKWYSVEIARFPSRFLADSIRTALDEKGWRPLTVREDRGEFQVLLGESSNIGQAYFLLKELKVLSIADGRIIQLDPERDQPREFSGPTTPPFAIWNSLSPEEKRAKIGELIQDLREQQSALEPADQTGAAAIISAFDKEGALSSNTVGEGAARIAHYFWENGSEDHTPLILGLSTLAASGEWPTPPEEPAYRQAAQDVAFEMLYGEERDWRSAWKATRAMIAADKGQADRIALHRLRQAALLVDLYAEEVTPGPSLDAIRLQIRQAYEICPEADLALRARMELFYIQTLAWDGRWERVERVAEGMLRRHDDNAELVIPVSHAKILYAQSLERTNNFEEALKVLETVTRVDITGAERLRMGMEKRDPVSEARERIEYFRELQSSDSELAASASSFDATRKTLPMRETQTVEETEEIKEEIPADMESEEIVEKEAVK